MKPTLEQIKKVRDIFGPCSVIYECYEEEDLNRLILSEEDLDAVIRQQLKVEDYRAEQSGHSIYQEWKTLFLPAIKERLNEAGLYGCRGCGPKWSEELTTIKGDHYCVACIEDYMYGVGTTYNGGGR